MSKNQIQRKSKNKVAISTKLAIKICEPYMNKVLKVCYYCGGMAYDMSFEKWCEIVNERLKNDLGKD